MSVPAKQIDGDVLVGRNITAGGDATVRGSATVDHDVTVKGWLYAPNIKSEIITDITADITKIYGLLKGLDSALDEAALAQYLIQNKYVTQSWVNDILKGYLTKQIADGLYQPKGDYPTYDLSIYLTKTEAASTYLEKSVFDELFEKVNIGTDANPKWAIRAKYGLYTNDFLAGKGIGVSSEGGSGDGSGSMFGLMREWPAADPGSTTDDALGANLGWELHNKVSALEAKNFLDALGLTVTGSGNAVTNVALSADHKTLTVTKGTTFLTQHQSLANYLTKSEAASTYLTAITKQMVENVLTGNITSHTHSQYLTSHQAIYALTFAAGSFSAKTYNPKSAATTVNIPTTTSHIAEGTNKYYTDARAIAALKPTTDTLNTAITDFRTLFDSMFERESDGKGGYVIHAKYGLYTNDFLAGKGLSGAPSSGGGGGSLFGLYTDTTWVSTPAEDDALSAVLGKSLHARVSVLEGAGYLTGITKAMVEAVLTGDITSHTHSQYIAEKTAAELTSLTITSGADSKIVLNNTDNDTKYQMISFRQNGSEYGWLGTAGDNNLMWNGYTLLHTGNYASRLDSRYVTLATSQNISGVKTFTDGLHLKMGDNFANYYNDGLRIHVCGSEQWASLLFCGADNTGDAGTSANSWGLFVHDGAFGIGRNGNGISSGTSRLWCDADNTWNISGLLKIGSLNVASNALVANLNAELLGGLNVDKVRSTAMRFFGWMQPTSSANCDLNLLTYGMARNYWGQSKWTNAPSGMGYGAAITFSQYDYDNLYGQLAWDVNHYTADVTGKLFWRAFATASDGTNKWGGWRQIAFTDGTIANATNAVNADIAGKLRINNSAQEDCLQYMQKGSGWNAWDAPSQTYYHVIKMNHGNGDTFYNRTLVFSFFDDRIYAGRMNSGNFIGWKTLAFLDDNVASATKLLTARSIWGQSFDGTSAISGELQHVTALRFDSGNALVEGLGNAWNLWSVNGFQFFPTMSATVSALSITTNGRVGVNMYAPAYDFDVTGVIHASGEIFSDKSIGGKGMTSSSDIRLKHIIGDVKLSFEAILNSPSKRFTWLGGADKNERIGTIAQYWLPILPQVVYTAPDGYYAVDYGTLANAKADTIAHVVARLIEELNEVKRQLNSIA